jgi:hypothetical protein
MWFLESDAVAELICDSKRRRHDTKDDRLPEASLPGRQKSITI